MSALCARAVGALALASTLLSASLVMAHASGLSRGDYRRTAEGLDVELGFAPSDAAALLPELDRDQDGTLTAAELEPNLVLAAESAAAAGLEVTQGDGACSVASSRATASGDGGLELHARFRCPRPALAVEVSLTLLDRLATGHRHAAQLSGAESAGKGAIYFGEQQRFSLPGSLTIGDEARATPKSWSAFVRLGFEHILSGADHIAFLLALVLSSQRTSSLVRVISAFTLAHSLTLGLVVLKVCAPPVSLVEPAIALSVAYVGIENLLGVDTRKRWRLAFVFGLVHGFGFAAALREVSFPASRLASTLLLFNVGVELGQLALLAAAVPLFVLLQRFPWFGARLAPALSVAVVGSGIFWFASRCVS